ncbi:glycine cleavage system H-protein subunit [Hypoxylon texense]
MSTSRVFVSSFRAVARRAAPRSAVRLAVRRGYASSGHGGSAGAEKSSDLPWLIGSVAVTVPGVAWLLSTGPKKADAHHHEAPVPDEEKAPAVESTPPASDSDSDSKEESSNDNNNPNAASESSQTGAQVPPPSADSTDPATNAGAKREAHEQYKETVERKDTRAASSASDMPSKKAAAEHPREDPQKGEGEGVKKGGPSS